MNNKSFDYKRIAEGYKDRPFLHKQVMEQLKNDMHIDHFQNGLDVGCGAGLSTRGLKLICDNVTGTDISEEMVLAAKEMCLGKDYTFFVSKAEEIPNSLKQYDIVTAAGVISWIDESAFLRNLSKIMEKDGLLLVYDFWISDKMKNVPEYTDWFHNEYLKAFPKPLRKENIWKKEDVEPYGFQLQKQTTYQLEYEFSQDAFIRFMMIQTNVNAKIEEKGQDINKIRAWFEASLEKIFVGKKQTLVFEGYSWYIIMKEKF